MREPVTGEMWPTTSQCAGIFLAELASSAVAEVIVVFSNVPAVVSAWQDRRRAAAPGGSAARAFTTQHATTATVAVASHRFIARSLPSARMIRGVIA